MLTPPQLQALKQVKDYARSHRRWPSAQDIADKRHTARLTAHQLLRRIAKQGYLQRLPLGQYCGWALTQQAYALLKAKPITIASVAPPKATQRNPGLRADWWRRKHLAQRANTSRYDAIRDVQLRTNGDRLRATWTDPYIDEIEE